MNGMYKCRKRKKEKDLVIKMCGWMKWYDEQYEMAGSSLHGKA